MLYKTAGIIIKRSNLGEFDRLLTIYTQEFGKILVKGKAIRKNYSKLRGHLELFLQSHLLIAPSKSLDVITGAETIERFSYLHRQLPSLSAAYYLSELVDQGIAGPEKNDQIWQLILSGFRNLNQAQTDIQALLNNFQKELSYLLGYGGKNFLQKSPYLLR